MTVERWPRRWLPITPFGCALLVALTAACDPGGAAPSWPTLEDTSDTFEATDAGLSEVHGAVDVTSDAGVPDGWTTADGGPEVTSDGSVADAAPSEPENTFLPTRYPQGVLISPINRYVTDHLLTLAAIHPEQQDDVFMKVGASSTVTSTNLTCFASEHVNLADDVHLMDALTYFLEGDAAGTNPFERETKAAKIGMSAVWAIGGDPSPMDQEMADISPRYAFVHYGTNDMGLGTTYLSALFPFANNYLTLVDTLVSHGVIPILVSISARGDKESADWMVDTYNNVIRGVGQGRQVPFVDLHLALGALPGDGLAGDGIHLNTFNDGGYRPCIFTEEGLSHGMNTRNHTSLVALDALYQVLVLGEDAPDDGAPIVGLGTSDDPIVIDALPFSHMANTAEAIQSDLDAYTGCDATQDESGGEFIYRLELTETERIRALVMDRGDVDIDLHILDETGTAAGCLTRAHQVLELTLEPGTWHIALDTFVSGDTPKEGEYLFTIVRCDPNDSSCD